MNNYTFKPEDIDIASWGSSNQGSFQVGVERGVQVTHLPTGIVVQIESERSQHRNRAIALDKLESILDMNERFESLYDIKNNEKKDQEFKAGFEVRQKAREGAYRKAKSNSEPSCDFYTRIYKL